MSYIQYAFKREIINCKQQSYNYHNKNVTSSKVVNDNEFPGKNYKLRTRYRGCAQTVSSQVKEWSELLFFG